MPSEQEPGGGSDVVDAVDATESTASAESPTGPRAEEPSFVQVGLDALPTQTAILDDDGTIVYTNEAWKEFALDNGYEDEPSMLGVNYLSVCDGGADDEPDGDSTFAATGIRSVIAGERGEFSFEYPCHSPTERRWFTMRAIRFRHADEPYVLVIHLNITDRKLSELRVEERNGQLDTLNRISVLVRDIVGSLFDVESRDELESLVCHRLADSEFFEAAWMTDLGERDDHLPVRYTAGADGWPAGAIDDVTPASTAVARARETGETVAAHAGDASAADDVETDGLLEAARERGFESYLAVPVVYRGATHGVLVVHAPATEAFSDWERAAFEVLGETVGYAISAVENRKLLYADYVTELEFGIDGAATVFAPLTAEADCEVELTGFVPLSAGAVIEYLTVHGATAEEVETVLGDSEFVEAVTVIGEFEDGCRIECSVAEDSVVNVLSDQGVKVRSARAADGELRVVAEAPADADIGTVVEAVRRVYPEADLLAKRERERETRTIEEYWEELEADLTDRQLSMLRAAYHAGFFEWPRESSGEDVAASFDIAPATFHQHMRVGLGKLLSRLFESRD
ncbi:bacterio-opsin activator domain-containing protein [Halobium salinum]|uniref:Bacterio-opsin activator domain-containing protein n=1 Tax=Halobium salinum TaxID=1364940 RepID=A0ABD5PC79_9EURY|nr:bacterio-opsin activator domain-containing protein [Halobium salinum]